VTRSARKPPAPPMSVDDGKVGPLLDRRNGSRPLVLVHADGDVPDPGVDVDAQERRVGDDRAVTTPRYFHAEGGGLARGEPRCHSDRRLKGGGRHGRGHAVGGDPDPAALVSTATVMSV